MISSSPRFMEDDGGDVLGGMTIGNNSEGVVEDPVAVPVEQDTEGVTVAFDQSMP